MVRALLSWLGLVALLFLSWLASPGPALAYGIVSPITSVCNTSQVVLNGTSAAAGSKCGSSAVDVCSALASGASTSGGYSFSSSGNNASSCYVVIRQNGSIIQYLQVNVSTSSACPSGSSLDAQSRCVCSQGSKPGTSGCVANDCQAVVASLQGFSLSWSGRGLSTCYQGCKLSASIVGYLSSSNKSSAESDFFVQGTCDGADASTGTDSGTSGGGVCPANQCPGQVNGTNVCVACSSQSVPPTSGAASGASGSNLPTIPNAPTGTVSQERQTQCDSANCTTTTTFKDSNGNVIGTYTESKPVKSFCGENPGSPLCVQSTFSGGCNVAPACTGDAIQCAIATDQYARACEFFNDTSASTQLASGVAGVSRPSGHPAGSGVSTSMSFASVIDQTDLLGSGCPGDIGFSIQGHGVSIPLSSVCSQLQVLGNILVALSMLAAAFIVFKG